MRMNIDDLLTNAPSPAEYLAVYTNNVEVGFFTGNVEKADNLLELRVFTRDREVRFFRDSVAAKFEERPLDDNRYSIYRDEEQYLDIAEHKQMENGGIQYITTGGGSFTLPYSKPMRKVKLRRYLKANEATGLYEFVDWRILEFIGEGE